MTKQRFHPGRDKPRLDQPSNPETDGLEVRRWRRGTTSRRNLTSGACQGTSSVRCVARSDERFRRPESTCLAQSAARRCAWSLVQTHARTAVIPSRSRSTCLVCRLHVDREAGINRQRLKNRPCLVGEGDCSLYPVRDLITVRIPDGHAELHRPFHAPPPFWSLVVLLKIPARTPVHPRAHHGDGSPSLRDAHRRRGAWQALCPCARKPPPWRARAVLARAPGSAHGTLRWERPCAHPGALDSRGTSQRSPHRRFPSRLRGTDRARAFHLLGKPTNP